MSLWHFPLARRRAPSFAAYDTPEAAERDDSSARSALALLALFGAPPRDRALTGWSPGDLSYAAVELKHWARVESAARKAGAALWG